MNLSSEAAIFEKVTDIIVPTNLVRHDISAGNLLYGSALFVSLNLPPRWDLAPGVGRPEIIAGHERNGRKWVASGRAWYVVFDAERRWAMELALRVKSLSKKQRNADGIVAPEVMVHGHPATVHWRQGERGLFRRRNITFLHVEFACPVSDRHLTVELSGHCPQEGFEELLAVMPYWRCH